MEKDLGILVDNKLNISQQSTHPTLADWQKDNKQIQGSDPLSFFQYW